MNERTDERTNESKATATVNERIEMNKWQTALMLNSIAKNRFSARHSAFSLVLFFHALELSYVNEKVIMNLKRKKKEKIILPVAHVRCQFTFKLLCMGSLICPSLFYARLSQSELCWSANNMSETTGTPLSFAAFYLNCKSNIHRTIFFYHFHNTHDFIGFFFIS